MKHLLYISPFLLIISCASRRAKISPPGTVKLNDTTYIDRYPITNFEYLEFLNSVSVYWSERTSDSLINLTPYGYTSGYLSMESSNMIATVGKSKQKIAFNIFEKPFYAFPDSMLFHSMNLKDTMLYDRTSMQTYLTHPAYRDYPVLNIHPTQAATFCKWRSDMVKIHAALNNKDSSDYSNYAQLIEYRLPTQEEWLIALKQADLDYSNHEDSLFQATDPVVDIYYYSQKKKGFEFYTFPGYLSEIVADNQLINYSWKDSVPNSIEFVRPFEKISPGTGFRCACDVKK